MQDPDDASLVARTVAGDTAAFEILVARHQRVLFRVALRMLGDYADASDVTQITFIKAYEKLETFDPAYRFFSWIYRILLNECLNAKRSRRCHDEVTTASAMAAPAPRRTPLDSLEAFERRRRVQKALLELPPDSRVVVVLRYFGELSYEEMATTLDLPVRTVKSRLYTARQRLIELLVGEMSES